MLKKEKNLNIKEIQGKRIRTPSLDNFYLSIAILSLPFLPFLISFLFAPPSWETIKILLLTTFLPVFGIFLLIFLSTRAATTTVGVLSYDKLYFFQQDLIEINANTERKKRSTCSGSIDYTDIKNMVYVPAVQKWRITRYVTLTPEKVLLQGDCFQLTFHRGGKSIIRKINKIRGGALDCTTGTQDLPNFEGLSHERNGIWSDIWESFDKHQGKGIFDEKISLSYFNNDEESNIITLIVTTQHNEIIFSIDEEELYMNSESGDDERCISLSKLSSVEDLYTQMRHFVSKFVALDR